MRIPRHHYRSIRISLFTLALSLVAGIVLSDRNVYKAAAGPLAANVSKAADADYRNTANAITPQ